MSLRTRLLAGMAFIALVLVAAAATITITTRAHLIAQVDDEQGPMCQLVISESRRIMNWLPVMPGSAQCRHQVVGRLRGMNGNHEGSTF